MTGSTNEGKLWGGRFAGGPSPELEALSRSTHFDWRLVPYDLAGSRAHANALHRAGLLTDDDHAHAARAASTALGQRVRRGRRCARTRPTRTCTAPSSGCCIERGRPRGRRPAARRPQPQRPGRHAVQGLPARPGPRRRRRWSSTSSTRSPPRPRDHLDVVMPGRTHLQHAQPVLLSHHLLAHAWPLLRDVERLRDWDARVAADSPYGSGALAGSSLGLDPQAVARELGFTDSSANSIDGTAARDFVAEFAFVTAMIGVDLSRHRRGGHPLGDRGVRLRRGSTTPTRPGRASCRRRRTPTSPSWPAASPAG